MMRSPNDNNFYPTPIRGASEFDESQQSDPKKSKNRHLTIINQLRRKEDQWDSRFYLDKIPSYRCDDDRHCETYKKMLIKKRNKKYVVRADQKVMTPSDAGNYRRPETYDRGAELRVVDVHRNLKSREKSRDASMKRHMLPSEGLVKEKKVQEERIMALWSKLNIPMFHRESFLKCENAVNVKQTVEIIKREADDLEHNTSTIQLALRAITARENCLKQLKILLDKLENNSEAVTEEEARQKSSELLTHLRILSLNAVETILRWREYIQQAYYITRGVVKAHQTIIIPFMYKDETNYLIKMKNDIRYLSESHLANYFNFSSKSDPFLVYPSKEVDQSTDKIVLYISKNLINRIRACELVILEESVHEHMTDKGTPQTVGKSVNETPQGSGKSIDNVSEKQRNAEGGKQNNIRIKNVPNRQERVTSASQPTRPTKQVSNNRLPEDNAESSQPKQNMSTESPSDKPQTPQRNNVRTPVRQNRAEENSPAKQVSSPTNKKPESPPKSELKTPQRPKSRHGAGGASAEEASPSPIAERLSQFTSPVKGATSEFVKAVDIYEDEIEAYVEQYLGELDNNMRLSFLSDPKELLQKANRGQDPTWFQLVNPEDNKRVGIAVCHIDNTVFTTRRMVILHCTLTDRELYTEYLGKLIQYLWNSDECNEIKISLYHFEDGENKTLAADKELTAAIKTCGFRWKQLTNTAEGKRYIDYILKRPEDKQYQGQKFNDEPIHVESVVVLSDLEGGDNVGEAYTHNELVDNRFGILGAILKHCEEKMDAFADGDSARHRNYLSMISSLIKEEKSKIGELVDKFQNLNDMIAFVGGKFENKDDFLPQIDQKYASNKYTTALLNLIYRWKSYNITHHMIAGKDREYLKINNNKDLVQFNSKYENSTMYFLPTDDEQVNIFITDNEKIINKIINKEEIIEDVVSKLFSKLDKNPTEFAEDLWIPLFSIHQRNVELETAKGFLKGDDKINFAKSTNVIGLNGNKVNGNLKVRPTEKSKIIEKAFLFGVVHDHVDFPLVSVVVNPEDFLEYKI